MTGIRARSLRQVLSLAAVVASALLAACGGGGGSDSGSGTVAVTAPSISTQPQNAAVNAGQTATFTVTATGSAPLNYQWSRNGTAISGATTASYTTPATAASDNGASFTVTVSNSAGSVTSGAASLTVTVPTPTITTQPQSTAVASGQAATFTVAVSSALPVTYQWQKNGSNVSAATSASYPTPATTGADNGSEFDVVVSGAAGSITSSTALLGLTHTLGLIAGALGGPGYADAAAGPATAASFNGPAAVATDASGNVYVADGSNNTIRKITPGGVVSTFAGTAGTNGSADGTGAAAQFNGPAALTVDTAGNVYVADTGNDTIRKVTPAGVVTTIAGMAGVAGSGNGVGPAAHFDVPSALAVDPAGSTLYVVDTNNSTVRKIVLASATVSTLAGSPGITGSTDNTGGAARFYFPAGMALDAVGGNLYVVDTFNCTVRKIVIASAAVTTIAGTAGNCSGSADGTAGAAQFSYPTGAALDPTAVTLYVADTQNFTVRKLVLATGAVSTLAGKPGHAGFSNGTGAAASFSNAVSLATDGSGDVFVADSTLNLIREITSAGVVSTYAGNLGGLGYADGSTGAGSTARFDNPHNLVFGPGDILYVADQTNNVIRKIAAGAVSTFAGAAGAAGVGPADGTGASAQFNQPFGMAVDSHGNLFVADSANNTVRKITPAGAVTTFVGTAGAMGAADGTGAAAQFNQPLGVAIDGADTVYVADCGNNTIRKITPAGVVTTFAGTAGTSGSADGTGTTASFNCPHGLAVNLATGVLYVADRFNDTIRRITTAGAVTTIAGTAGASDFVDGAGGAAHFSWPGAIAVDATTGTLYVTDYRHHAIRKIVNPDSAAPAVTTVVGFAPGTTPAPVGVVLGSLPGALNGPTSIAVVPGSSVQLVFSDASENSILMATLP